MNKNLHLRHNKSSEQNQYSDSISDIQHDKLRRKLVVKAL